MFNSSSAGTDTTPGKVELMKSSLKRLLSLYIENAKLTAIEKLTLLLSAGVVFFVGSLLLTFTLAFCAIALRDILELALNPIASAAILGGTFLLLAVLLVVFRKPLVVNPIARFIAKLIMDIGTDPTKEQ